MISFRVYQIADGGYLVLPQADISGQVSSIDDAFYAASISDVPKAMAAVEGRLIISRGAPPAVSSQKASNLAYQYSVAQKP